MWSIRIVETYPSLVYRMSTLFFIYVENSMAYYLTAAAHEPQLIAYSIVATHTFVHSLRTRVSVCISMFLIVYHASFALYSLSFDNIKLNTVRYL